MLIWKVIIYNKTYWKTCRN